MEQKKVKVGGLYVLTVIILIAALACGALTGFTFTKMNDKMDKMGKDITKLGEEEVVENSEDDVVIAGSYTIKSTTQISDAYKSGDNSKLSDEDKETLQMASDVLKDVIKDGMSDYEKEIAVYEWVTKNISTGSSSLTPQSNDPKAVSTPNGVLKNHKSVCVGYATTFRLLMQMLDIDCKVVHNNENYHSWDMVKLDDEWYHVDCYSDSGTSNYANFNMNDAMSQRNHDWDKEFFPSAVGIKYNYAVQNAIALGDIWEVPKKLREAFEQGGKNRFFNIGTDEDGNKGRILQGMADNVYAYTGEWGDVTFSMVEGENKQMILCLYISSYNNPGNQGVLSEEDLTKVNETYQQAFEGYAGEGMATPPVEDGNASDDQNATGDGN